MPNIGKYSHTYFDNHPEEKDKEPLVTTGPSIMNLSAAGFGVSSIRVICKIKSFLKNVGLNLDVQIVK